jgi:hypothetical protein
LGSTSRELWNKALSQLQDSGEDRHVIANAEEIAKELASEVNVSDNGSCTAKSLVADIKKKMEEQIRSRQHDGDTSHFVGKTVSILNKFLAIGDVAVSFDPIHAALPWAAVRFILVVSCPHMRQQIRCLEVCVYIFRVLS